MAVLGRFQQSFSQGGRVPIGYAQAHEFEGFDSWFVGLS